MAWPLLALAGAVVLAGDDAATGPATQLTWELSKETRAALATVRDFAFDFDQPGFYAVVAEVRHNPHSPGHVQTPLSVVDWRDLLERPGEFRGRPITITGRIARNRDPYELPNHPELGALSQLELQRPDQPIVCTVVCTTDVADLPLQAEVEFTGYFVLIRQYYSETKRVQQAALIVAPGPTTVSHSAPMSDHAAALDWSWLITTFIFGLGATAYLLWRAARAQRQDLKTLTARHPAPTNLADELQAWAAGPPAPDSQERAPDDH